MDRQEKSQPYGQAGREAITWTGRKTGSHMDRQEDRQSHGQAGRQAVTWTGRKRGSRIDRQKAGRQQADQQNNDLLFTSTARALMSRRKLETSAFLSLPS